MLILFGVYNFARKNVAFRNDYCLSCKAPRKAVQTRSFDAFHIYYLPLSPLGFWKHWYCSACDNDPHARTTTNRAMKWIGFAILLLLTAVFWVVMPAENDDRVMVWVFRIGAPVGAVLTLVYLERTPKEPPLQELLAGVPPADETACPFCNTPLLLVANPYCPKCGVQRL